MDAAAKATDRVFGREPSACPWSDATDADQPVDAAHDGRLCPRGVERAQKTSGIDPFRFSCTAASRANLISRRRRRWRAVPSTRSFLAPQGLHRWFAVVKVGRKPRRRLGSVAFKAQPCKQGSFSSALSSISLAVTVTAAWPAPELALRLRLRADGRGARRVRGEPFASRDDRPHGRSRAASIAPPSACLGPI